MTGAQPLILELLTEREILTANDLSDLARARARYGDSIEEALIRSGMVSDLAIAETYADYLAVPVLFEHEGLVEECLAVKDRLPQELCRKRKMVPLALQDGVLEIACLNPADQATLEEARFLSGCVVQMQAAPLGLLEKILHALFGARDMVRELAGGEAGGGAEQRGTLAFDLDAPVAEDREGRVVRLVNVLLSTAIKEGASDIHLETYEGRIRVRYRVDGQLEETTPPPRSLFLPVLSRLKVLARMDISERRIPQDGAIATVCRGRRVDLRASTCPTVFGEKMVLRILAKEETPASLRQLGFSKQQDEEFMEALCSPHGLVLVTGPTGSGKSTTLYTGLDLINRPTINISTVEDPVEYRFDGLNQCHVRANVGMTFATALRAFLRQDPDIMMVGEVRDQETARICLRAALTGHLVLSTLHTNDSLQAVHRLVDMGIEPFLLGPALRLVQAQRLVRRLCNDCKVAHEVPERLAERYGLEPGATLYGPADGGCERCRRTGYRGRIGLFEVVPIGEELGRKIMAQSPYRELVEQARGQGVLLLSDAARKAVAAGRTSLDEAAELLEGSSC